MLREAARVLGQRNDAVNAFDIVGLALQKAVGQCRNQSLPIGGLMQAPIAGPYAGGLNNQVALLFKIIERGDDSLARLSK